MSCLGYLCVRGGVLELNTLVFSWCFLCDLPCCFGSLLLVVVWCEFWCCWVFTCLGFCGFWFSLGLGGDMVILLGIGTLVFWCLCCILLFVCCEFGVLVYLAVVCWFAVDKGY